MPKIIAKKEDWIRLGYTLFAKQGISGIVIEKMSKKLSCNKSSFYWHFKTKKEFVEQVVKFWVTNETKETIKLTNTENAPSKKFKKLIAIVYKKEPFLDFIFYLKRYAQKEQRIQDIIDEIDNTRIAYVKDLLQGLGYSKQEAKIKSALFYKHLIGYHEMIRYKKQDKNYAQAVKKELNQFIKY